MSNQREGSGEGNRAIAEKIRQLARQTQVMQIQQELKEGKADAFATDDILLYGLLATARLGDRYHVVGEYLSFDLLEGGGFELVVPL
jgi:ABC-type amino acid transport substrate-binding protein